MLSVRFRGASLLLGLLMSVAVSSVQAEISIQLRSEVNAARRDIVLDDVAIVRSTDYEALKALIDFPLGRYVGSGLNVVLDQRALSQWVARHGPDVGPVEWGGADRVFIAFATPVASRDCATDAQNMLESWLANRYVRFKANVQSIGAVPSATQECRVRSLRDDVIPASRMTLWADIFEDGRFVRSMAMRASVNAFQDVWVARGAIAAGEAAVLARFGRRSLDVARQSVVPPPVGWENGGYRVARNMAEGQPLSAALLEAAPDVERGASAVFTMRVGGVQLDAAVQVLQDGRVGTTVPVRVSGGKSIMARVVSPGRLEASQ